MESAVIEKVIDDIYIHFVHCDVIEVDFMPTTGPPYVLLESKVLGLSFSILKPLYKHAYTHLCSAYTNFIKSSQSYSATVMENLHKLSTAVLTVKGDLTIAYNIRKVILLHLPQLLSKEILFLQAVFTKHPKSPSGWEHRRWCYLQRFSLSHGIDGSLHDLKQSIALSVSEVETERELCRVMAEKYPKNYYAWMHRLWLMPHFTPQQFEDELDFLSAWLLMHISDHSAAQHYIQVLQYIIQYPACYEVLGYLAKSENNDSPESLRQDFIRKCWKQNEELLVSRPGHESLWCMRRNLLQFICTKSLISTGNVIEIWPKIRKPLQDFVNFLAISSSGTQEEDSERQEGQVTSASSDDKSKNGLNLFAEDEVLFIIRHIQLALSGQIDSIWDTKQQVITSLRYLVYFLRSTCTDPPLLIATELQQIIISMVDYFCLHDKNHCYIAYISS